MQLHEPCIETSGKGGQDLRWKIKVEVNQDGACTKYHDDMVEVRFAMTLAGEGTVLAENAVDWDLYASSGGAIPGFGRKPRSLCGRRQEGHSGVEPAREQGWRGEHRAR